MSLQPALFDSPEIVRSPICSMQTHCGSKAELGPPIDHGGCINRTIRCLSCGATGVESTRKDLR